jgi:uncharacterized HhH-GPD family protein
MAKTKTPKLYLSGQPDADALLSCDPLALVIGMVLDQQIPLEWAFAAPAKLRERLGHDLDAAEIGGYDEEALVRIFTGPPALHRFPGSMAKRVQQMCRHLVAEYDADAAGLWTRATDGANLLARVQALPGFGATKARIFVGLLGKRLGVRPAGWDTVAADWPSIADVDSFERVLEIREKKKAMKAAAKQRRSAPN